MCKDGDKQTRVRVVRERRRSEKPKKEKRGEPPEPNWRILLHRLKQTGGGCLMRNRQDESE